MKCRKDLGGNTRMTLSSTVAEWAAAYEQECGKKPNEQVLQIAEHISKVGKILRELGKKDAQQEKNARPTNVFPALVEKAFRLDVDEDHETVQAVADLWQSDYMDGYNSAKEEFSPSF